MILSNDGLGDDNLSSPSFQAAYYGALTALHMGMVSEEENQYGLRVSWYKLAMERFDESLRAAEDIGIEDTLAFTRDVIGD